MGVAVASRARLARRLDELQRRLATHATVDDPGPCATTDRIAAVAPAIEELDVLGRESRSAWATRHVSGPRSTLT